MNILLADRWHFALFLCLTSVSRRPIQRLLIYKLELKQSEEDWQMNLLKIIRQSFKASICVHIYRARHVLLDKHRIVLVLLLPSGFLQPVYAFITLFLVASLPRSASFISIAARAVVPSAIGIIISLRIWRVLDAHVMQTSSLFLFRCCFPLDLVFLLDTWTANRRHI